MKLGDFDHLEARYELFMCQDVDICELDCRIIHEIDLNCIFLIF